MKKTIRTSFNRDGFLDTIAQRGLEGFAGQEVTITVETAEKEKPKVQMCQCGDGCKKSAAWLTKGGGGTWYHCNEHLWRAMSLHREGTYTITPIPPQPPEPVVVEWEINCRDQTSTLIKVPTILENKRIKVRLTEVPD